MAGSASRLGKAPKRRVIVQGEQGATQLVLTLERPSSGSEKRGAVYTRRWVVDLILDLAGYTIDGCLSEYLAVEPAGGDGAFAIPMACRLISSCLRRGLDVRSCAQSLIVFEIDASSADLARQAVCKALRVMGVAGDDASYLADGWVHTGDYLFEAPKLPAADFVIGNPPYIRLEEIDDLRMGLYRSMYPTMGGRADIYIGFFEAALRQLKQGGVCAFICADRWMLNHYGSGLRQLVTLGYSVEAIIGMHTANAFERDVSAYPAVTVIRREQQGAVVVASAGSAVDASSIWRAVPTDQDKQVYDPPALPQGLRAARVDTWFQDDDPWPYTSPERLALLKRLEHEFEPLESSATGTMVGIGVATGLDEVFITTQRDLVEPSRLLPLAMAQDLISGTLRWSGHYLVNPWCSDALVDLAAFPKLAQYYLRHRTRLSARHVSRRNPAHWYRTIDRVHLSLIVKHKLYIPDIKDVIHPVLDMGQTYPHHNLYYVQSEDWDLEVLGGLLLSAVAQLFVECYGVRMRGGYLRFQAQYLRRIRVPRPQALSEAQMQGLRQAFRTRKEDQATCIARQVYRIHDFPMDTSGG